MEERNKPEKNKSLFNDTKLTPSKNAPKFNPIIKFSSSESARLNEIFLTNLLIKVQKFYRKFSKYRELSTNINNSTNFKAKNNTDMSNLMFNMNTPSGFLNEVLYLIL